jgi:hypothetical protein
MKTILLIIVAIISIASVGCCSTKVSNKNISYEHYCDSIWEADPDYYLDVLVETDEYQEYLSENGEWF